MSEVAKVLILIFEILVFVISWLLSKVSAGKFSVYTPSFVKEGRRRKKQKEERERRAAKQKGSHGI